MIIHLGDHPGLPLFFGVVTKNQPMQLVTQFHGEKNHSLTLSTAIRKKKMEKSSWLFILRKVIEALHHVHRRGVLHNDLKANNIVLEKRKDQWNPVVIDFGKARFITDPKPLMTLSESSQELYKKKYPYIAVEIVCGKGRQSVASDIFSVGKIALSVLDLLPTATSLSLKLARKAIRDDPAKRPGLNELLNALSD